MTAGVGVEGEGEGLKDRCGVKEEDAVFPVFVFEGFEGEGSGGDAHGVGDKRINFLEVE